jgi:hypothetical protein
MTIQPIETHYAGCRFRSRLEARWAVFFDALGIEWEYEMQGYLVGPAQRPYLPDFFLPTSGTWIEVKGSEDEMDRGLIFQASCDLPDRCTVRGPKFLLLGPIPDVRRSCDLGWLGFDPCRDEDNTYWLGDYNDYWGFDGYVDRGGMQWIDISGSAPLLDSGGREIWLEPADCNNSGRPHAATVAAYRAARSARFEHGESG